MSEQDTQLENLRRQIDALDKQLLELLSKRMSIVREVGQYKQQHDLEPLDPERWQTLLAERLELATSLDLSEAFVSELYRLIHEYALAIEAEAAS
ncbi:MAG TPA: chorismate mutase [Candidatus Saccharimonadales bacterium]